MKVRVHLRATLSRICIESVLANGLRTESATESGMMLAESDRHLTYSLVDTPAPVLAPTCSQHSKRAGSACEHLRLFRVCCLDMAAAKQKIAHEMECTIEQVK